MQSNSASPNPRRSDGALDSQFSSYSVGVSDPFEFTINNLDYTFLPNTTYYVRAYVVTENEVVVYGNQVSFSTLPIYQNSNGVTDVEGNQYPSVVINGQEWMQNNLTVSKYSNGDIIPEVTDETQWANLTTGAWRYIANDPAYGKLYNWYAVNDPRGLAPQGWHVGTETEFSSLTNFLGGIDVAGGRMKGGVWGYNNSNGPCTIYSNEIQYNNISGFNALGGNQISENGYIQCAYGCQPPPIICGYYNGVPTYCGGGYVCYSVTGAAGNWWSATEVDSTTANYLGLTIDSASVTAGASDKKFGYSVRCVKN